MPKKLEDISSERESSILDEFSQFLDLKNSESKESSVWKILDYLLKGYFNNNFSLIPKSEIDMIMFELFFQWRVRAGKSTLDSELANELGITESRVRILKQKCYIRFKRENGWWKKAFSNLVSYARYNDKSDMVELHIPDVNMLREIRYEFEKRNWYTVGDISPKLLRCPFKFFFQFCLEISEDKDKADEVIRTILIGNKEDKKLLNENSKDFKEALVELGKDGFSNLISKATLKVFSKEAIENLLESINIWNQKSE